MSILKQITSPPQSLAEVVVNENFETLEHQGVYGKNQATTVGLVWGYYGGRWGGASVAAGTFTLGASTTTYLSVNRSTGAITQSTAATNWNDTATYARAYKLTTSGSAVTAVEDHRAGPNGVHGQGGAGAGSSTICIPVACSDEVTALSAGVGKVTFRMPFAMTLSAVRASLTTAQASGSIFTVDINESGTSVISTKLTIDNTEKTSTTAATPPVISDTALADDAEITIDIDQIGDGTAKGLKVYLIGTSP